MASPFFSVLFILAFELVSYTLTLQLPIVFTDRTDDDLLFLINDSDLLLVVALVLFAHFDLVKHFISFIDFLICIIRLLFLNLFNVLVFGAFKVKVFTFECLGCDLIQNIYDLFPTSRLELERREVTLN